MEKFVEKVPTWALPYLVSADASGLSDDEVVLVDEWCDRYGVQVVCPINESVEGELQPYFSPVCAFGLACDVVDCIVLCDA